VVARLVHLPSDDGSDADRGLSAVVRAAFFISKNGTFHRPVEARKRYANFIGADGRYLEVSAFSVVFEIPVIWLAIIRDVVTFLRKHGHAISLLPSTDGFFCQFKEGGMKVEEKEAILELLQVNGVSQILNRFAYCPC
jgi:hypothetical protein